MNFQRLGVKLFVQEPSSTTVSEDPDTVVEEFRKRFYDTELFHDKYARGKFARYLFHRHESPAQEHTAEQAHRLIEEAQLFIEAAHACNDRIADRQAASLSNPPALGTTP